MKLLIADDHNLFRDALVHYLERSEPDGKFQVARDVHEVMELVGADREGFDLVLLDLRMPGMNGLEGFKKLRSAYPETAVALISGVADPREVQAALDIGAAGYLPKTMSGKALLAAIRKILSGEIFIAKDFNTDEIMPSHYEDKSSELRNMALKDIKLTPREREVLGYLSKGKSNKEIARSLDVQVVTIKLHVRGICRKMGVKNRTQAALIAQQQGV